MIKRTFPPNPSEDYFFGGGTYLVWVYKAIKAHLKDFTMILDRSFASTYAYHLDADVRKIEFWVRQLPADVLFLFMGTSYATYMKRAEHTMPDQISLRERRVFDTVCERYFDFFRRYRVPWETVSGVWSYEQQIQACQKISGWPQGRADASVSAHRV